tara:strand:+ start:12343 stop:12867 length:525 start_codon:yes stop_codon:yes gene_type:complete
MCDPISIGIAIGAATGAAGAAITGGDVLQGALLGGITGGFTGGMGGLGAGSTASSLGGSLGASTSTSFINAVGSSVTQAGALGFGVMSLGGSVAMGQLFPQGQEASAYDQSAYSYNPIVYNSLHNQVTGSGGAQASAVLAMEIKKAKSNRQKQQDTGDTYVNTESFANTGLQLA